MFSPFKRRLANSGNSGLTTQHPHKGTEHRDQYNDDHP
jgi:hypothetical protein